MNDEFKFRVKVKLRYLHEKLSGLFLTYPKDNKIFIYGNQKSGTSAICCLLGLVSDSRVQNDFVGAWFPYFDNKNLDLNNFICANKYALSKKIIKEPNISLLLPELIAEFPNSNHVFVVRRAKENIASICKRLNVAPQASILKAENIPFTWQHILESKEFGGAKENPIAVNLALRWCAINELFLKHKKNLTLVKYEEFLIDKENYISKLAGDLSLPCTSSIKESINVQFQPASKMSKNIDDYFGDYVNLEIEKICNSVQSKIYGY